MKYILYGFSEDTREIDPQFLRMMTTHNAPCVGLSFSHFLIPAFWSHFKN
jgi:hypothetical protein